MVFEHQMHMMNLLTRLGWDARVADYERRPLALEILRETKEDVPDYFRRPAK